MRVLIVDDEPLARSNLARLCEEEPDLDVVGEAESGARAIAAINAERPELVLLDIELADMSGFDVLDAVRTGDEPLAIMVTGHAEHALRAFDAEALDYLTKPINEARFSCAIARARCRQPRAVASAVHEAVASEVRSALFDATKVAPRRLVAEKSRRFHFIDVDEVDYIEADGNYVAIHAHGVRYLARNTIRQASDALAPAGFVRIERSLLVNFRRVAYAERLGRGMFELTLRNGERLKSSVTYRGAILGRMRAS